MMTLALATARTGARTRPTGPHLLDPNRLGDHMDRLYRAALGLTGSPADAEDLVQDVCVRILTKPRMVSGTDDLGYLLRVLRNTWSAMRRSQAARPRTVELGEQIEWVADPGADTGATALQLRIAYDAIRELSDPLREAIVAVDIVGLSYRQAARALRVREGTIMSRLHRARERVADGVEGASR
jgi:RNA polymerase sigma-70 factor, ECF subfamily